MPSVSTSWRPNAIHFESGAQTYSRISHAFAWFTSVTFFDSTSTNWSRSFLSAHKIFFESGDQLISYL